MLCPPHLADPSCPCLDPGKKKDLSGPPAVGGKRIRINRAAYGQKTDRMLYFVHLSGGPAWGLSPESCSVFTIIFSTLSTGDIQALRWVIAQG